LLDGIDIKRRLILNVLRLRCKDCFQPLTSEGFLYSSKNDEANSFIFVTKKVFDFKSKPQSPITQDIRFIYEGTSDKLELISRDVTKQDKSRKIGDVVVVGMQCIKCGYIYFMESSVKKHGILKFW